MTSKALHILEGIAKHGPCTLDEITSSGDFTRSSVYRSLTKLEDSGWVRRSLDGRRYFLSSKIEDVVRHAPVPSTHAEHILDALRATLEVRKYHVVLLQQLRGDLFSIVDSSGGYAEALRMMFDLQEDIATYVDHCRSAAVKELVTKRSGLQVLQTKQDQANSLSSYCLVNLDCMISSIAILSKMEGLFIVICSNRNAVRPAANGLGIYTETLCEKLLELEELPPLPEETVVAKGTIRLPRQ